MLADFTSKTFEEKSNSTQRIIAIIKDEIFLLQEIIDKTYQQLSKMFQSYWLPKMMPE